MSIIHPVKNGNLGLHRVQELEVALRVSCLPLNPNSAKETGSFTGTHEVAIAHHEHGPIS